MGIEELELEVKVYNRLKKAGINTTDELLSEMYKGSSDIKVSAPDAKRCEEALKAVGIIKYVRGDCVTEDDIEPEPLTWDELHNYIGKLVAHDVSTESHRWLKVCWIYDIQDKGEGNLIYNDGGSGYGYSRCSTVNGDLTRDFSPYLKHSGRFFVLKKSEVPQVQQQSVIVESADYTKAVSLTRRIKANALSAQESLWELCKGLKEMHDSKLYKKLGYTRFEDYTEKEIGIKRHMAQKYISVAEVENGESIHQIGITKLSLLARLDEPQREQIQQNVDVESVSVKELKYKIAELEKNKAKLISDLESACADRDQERDWREELVDENGKMSDRISELIAQVDELESRPVEVTAKPDEELIKQHLKELDDMQREHKEELSELKEKYQKQMREGIEKAKKEAQAPDIEELWRALDNNLDNAIEAIEDFFDDYENHPKIKDYAQRLKGTVRDLNKLVNNILAGE